MSRLSFGIFTSKTGNQNRIIRTRTFQSASFRNSRSMPTGSGTLREHHPRLLSSSSSTYASSSIGLPKEIYRGGHLAKPWMDRHLTSACYCTVSVYTSRIIVSNLAPGSLFARMRLQKQQDRLCHFLFGIQPPRGYSIVQALEPLLTMIITIPVIPLMTLMMDQLMMTMATPSLHSCRPITHCVWLVQLGSCKTSPGWLSRELTLSLYFGI